MLPLNSTLPVPAFRVRSLCSPDWLSRRALPLLAAVNVMSPAPAPVSILRLLLSVTAPLRRTLLLAVVFAEAIRPPIARLEQTLADNTRELLRNLPPTPFSEHQDLE